MPPARADDPFTDIVTDVDAALNQGAGEVINGLTDIGNGPYGLGVDYTLFGLDDLLMSPGDGVVVGGFDVLTGTPVSPGHRIRMELRDSCPDGLGYHRQRHPGFHLGRQHCVQHSSDRFRKR